MQVQELNNELTYFIERKKDNKWYTKNGRWSFDPLQAKQFKTYNDGYAYIYNNKKLNKKEHIVTEHQWSTTLS